MSQLSFARFFDQAKEAAPVTHAKPLLPAVNAPTIAHQMMTTDEARRQFISVFRDTASNLRRWEVFSDFITLAASELDMARITILKGRGIPCFSWHQRPHACGAE